MGSLELVKAGTEVLEAGQPTLAELAAVANQEHALVLRSGVEMVAHAIRCGEVLLAAQSRIESGRKMAWVDGLDMSITRAHLYMRMAQYRDEIDDAKGITEAKEKLAALGLTRPGGGHGFRWSPHRDAARALRQEGHTYPQIAAKLDLGVSTVCRLVDDAVLARNREYMARYRKRRKREREALEQKQREQATKEVVRKEGGALAEAYALVAKLDGVLGQARREANDKDCRLAINEAHALRDKLMEQIIRALGVS